MRWRLCLNSVLVFYRVAIHRNHDSDFFVWLPVLQDSLDFYLLWKHTTVHIDALSGDGTVFW